MASAGVIALGISHHAKAEYLFNGFINPGFYEAGHLTEWSQWDWFTSAQFNPSAPVYNLPDNAGAPSNPPTIIQLNPAVVGSTVGNWGDGGRNIYSQSGPLSFIVADTTPYNLQTVVFQFQTGGQMVDFSSIRLEIDVGTGTPLTLYANDELYAEYIREYAGTSSSVYGGVDNRNSIQWDLRGLGNITSYRILFDTEAHTGFQIASLDTSASYLTAVPESRTWTASGASLTWGQGSNWKQGSAPSLARGNIKFENTSLAQLNLGANREVGEVWFNGADVTISGNTLRSNTGIITQASATQKTYTINSNYVIGATNMMDIATNTTVRINGSVGGSFGGIIKSGGGLLDLTASTNTFNSTNLAAAAGITVFDGTLRIGGTNVYSGDTTIMYGTLIVAANANKGSGALGVSANPIYLGPASGYANGPTTSAKILIEGNRTIARDIKLSAGQTQKSVGAKNTGTGTAATYSGNINLTGDNGATSNATFVAEGAGDHVIFSGNITGGSNGAVGTGLRTEVAIGGQGIVEYAGSSKTYLANTTVNAGAHLRVNTTFAGTGNLAMTGGTLSGAGIIKKDLMVDVGDIISPGNSVGKLTFGDLAQAQTLTFGGGGNYKWEMTSATGTAGTSWDLLEVYGTLATTATSGDKFIVSLNSTSASGFNPLNNYDWIILSATSGFTNFNANSYSIDASAFGNSIIGEFSLKTVGNNLVLSYVHVVPEPGKMMLLAAGAFVLIFRRRRTV